MLDTRWKSVGDADLIVRLLRKRVEMRVLRNYLSVFVDTGQNMSLGSVALKEMDALAREAPAWAQALRRFWVVLHRVRRMAFGLYRVKPFAAEFYTPASPQKRVRLDITNPTFHWKGRVDWRS
jgi:hypothetical protein